MRSAIPRSTGKPRDVLRVFRVATVVWALAILTATSLPVPDVSTALPTWADKAVHFTLYCILGILAALAFMSLPAGRQGQAPDDARSGIRRYGGWLVLALLAIFAGADELHQHWIRGRMPSPADWVADVAGAWVGIAIGSYICKSNRRPGSGIDRETDC